MIRDDVLRFINKFKGAEFAFTNGCCYWFAFILLSRFGGSIWYDDEQNHFVTKIDGVFYDVTGKTSGKFIEWNSLLSIDYIHCCAIIRDCILMEPTNDNNMFLEDR